MLPVAGITLLAALLRLWSLGGGGTNAYYDAAVRSMGRSWHNFFFGAFEPAGGVSIDKPPLDLWLQVVSTKVFGFNSTALMLPQAIAAVIAVPLLYDLVRRLFGHPAGLAAALALAVMPISVVTARSDTMDSLMMTLDVLAAWLVVRAAQAGRARFLLIAAAVVGINFDVKLFEALIPLPAIVVMYWLALRGRPRPRRAQLAAAVSILALAALAWPAIVSLVPRDSRPYPIGSTNGSVWNAIFVFNGIQRVNPPTYSASFSSPTGHTSRPRGHAVHHRHHQHHHARSSSGGLLSGTGDAPGPLRLFELGRQRYGQNLGIELAGAFAFGGLALGAALLGAWRRRSALRLSELGPEASLTWGGAALFAIWLLTGYVLFSRMHGGLHDRYLEAMTPAVAAALGVGVVECARLARRGPAGLVAFLAALVPVAVYAVRVGRPDTPLTVACAALAGAALAAGIAGLALGRGQPRFGERAVVAVAVLSLLCVLTPAATRSIQLVSQTSGGGVQVSRTTLLLSNFLKRNDGGAFYEAATYSFAPAAGLIVHDARPALVLTSYTSPVVRVPQLASAVRSGKVRYAIIGGNCGVASPSAVGGCPEAIRWLRRRSVDVTQQTGLRGRGLLFKITRAT